MPGKRLFNSLYRLHLAGAMWDRKTPEITLIAWVNRAFRASRRVLAVGCGTGAHAVALAQQGFEVDAVDFSAPGLQQARTRAHNAGVQVRFICTDVLDLKPMIPYDGVADFGCFHSLGTVQRQHYLTGLSTWTAPGSWFVLMALSPRWRLDWRLCGPCHLSPTRIQAYFSNRFDIVERREIPDYWNHVPAVLRVIPGPYRAYVYWLRRRTRAVSADAPRLQA